MELFVVDTYQDMSAKAAELVVRQLKSKPDSVLGFATGSTPEGLYAELVRLNKMGAVDFSHVRATFNLDEYFPINKANGQSYDYFMKHHLFGHIAIEMSKINIPNGEATDAAQECLSYEEKIAAAGGIDFQILGIGANGHIGFNEPGDYFEAHTHCVKLTPETIKANSRFFASGDMVPRQALTMGIKTIMSAQNIMLMVSGGKKAAILRDSLYGKITPSVPASILQLHRSVFVVADKEAAKYL